MSYDIFSLQSYLSSFFKNAELFFFFLSSIEKRLWLSLKSNKIKVCVSGFKERCASMILQKGVFQLVRNLVRIYLVIS